MTSDLEASVFVDAHPHDHSQKHDHRHDHAHGLPHSRGATVLRAVAASPDAGHGTNPPSMSLLRLSILARLAAAVVFATVIWTAIHWATL
jgi:hypothetical protein